MQQRNALFQLYKTAEGKDKASLKEKLNAYVHSYGLEKVAEYKLRAEMYAIAGSYYYAEKYIDYGATWTDVAIGYAHADDTNHLKQCISNGANLSAIAERYVYRGNHAKVKEFENYGIDLGLIANSYRINNFTSEALAYDLKHKQQIEELNCPNHYIDRFKRYSFCSNEGNSFYQKLRINFSKPTFVNNKHEIANIIIKAAIKYPQSIRAFKFIDKPIAYINKLERDFWAAAEARDEKALNQVAELYTDDFKKIRKEIAEIVTNSIVSNKPYVSSIGNYEEIKNKSLATVDLNEKTYNRFLDSLQYTIYINFGVNLEKLSNFTFELENCFSTIGFTPGAVGHSDVSVSKYFAIRQDRLQSDINKYLEISFMSEKEIEQSKSEVRSGLLYKTLFKKFNPTQEEEIINPACSNSPKVTK